MKATLVHKHKETQNITSFWFRPDGVIDYLAGQYIEMTIPHAEADDRGNWRWFTLSSSPTDAPLVSITTRLSPSPSSFKQRLSKLSPGDRVDISTARGDFVLPKQTDRPLVFVAGGIGISPFHSMIEWLTKTRQHRDITFIYVLKNESDMIFQDLFERYGMKRLIIISQPDENWAGLSGRLDGKRLLDLSVPSADSLIYIAGPNPFTESIGTQLAQLNFEKQRIVTEYYSGYDEI
jgi:ferredoxin-NADP reductase